MVQQVKVLAARPEDLGLIPASTRWKETTNSYKLSSDLHAAASVSHAHTPEREIEHRDRHRQRTWEGRKGRQGNESEGKLARTEYLAQLFLREAFL